MPFVSMFFCWVEIGNKKNKQYQLNELYQGSSTRKGWGDHSVSKALTVQV